MHLRSYPEALAATAKPHHSPTPLFPQFISNLIDFDDTLLWRPDQRREPLMRVMFAVGEEEVRENTNRLFSGRDRRKEWEVERDREHERRWANTECSKREYVTLLIY